MNQTFIKGLISGVVLTIGLLVLANFFILSQVNQSIDASLNDGISFEERNKWRKLPISKKIENTSALVLLRFKKEEETMAAYVDKVILRDSTILLPLKVGDRVEKSDFYVTEHSSPLQRNGVLVLYRGNPPKEIEGTYLYDDDLIAHNDMPIDLFVSKFKKSISE